MSIKENFPEKRYSKLIYIGKLSFSIFVTATLNLFFIQKTVEELLTLLGRAEYSSTVAWCISTALSVIITDVGLYYLYNRSYSLSLKEKFDNLNKNLKNLNKKYDDINDSYRNLIFHLISKSLTIHIPNWENNYLSKCKNHFSSSDLRYMQEISIKHITITSLEQENLNQAKHTEINNTFSL